MQFRLVTMGSVEKLSLFKSKTKIPFSCRDNLDHFNFVIPGITTDPSNFKTFPNSARDFRK